jgi:hypothetical protein
VICANGTSANICEHSALDGMSTQPLRHFMQEAITEELQTGSFKIFEVGPVDDSDKLTFEHLAFTTDRHIDDRVAHVWQTAKAAQLLCSLDAFSISDVGESAFRTSKISPKAAITLAVLLASSRFFGRIPATRETISLNTFHGGRAAVTQIVLPAVQEFCNSFAPHEENSKLEQQKLLYQAAAALTSNLIRSVHGDAFFPYLMAVETLSQREGGQKAALFSDPLYQRTQAAQLTIDSLNLDMTEAGGWGPQGVWVHFQAYDNRCVSLSNPFSSRAAN